MLGGLITDLVLRLFAPQSRHFQEAILARREAALRQEPTRSNAYRSGKLPVFGRVTRNDYSDEFMASSDAISLGNGNWTQ